MGGVDVSTMSGWMACVRQWSLVNIAMYAINICIAIYKYDLKASLLVCGAAIIITSESGDSNGASLLTPSSLAEENVFIVGGRIQ